jgi:hypothetical protein
MTPNSKKSATVYVVVTFNTFDGRTYTDVNFKGSKKQCDKYASDLLAAEVMTEKKYENLLTSLM